MVHTFSYQSLNRGKKFSHRKLSFAGSKKKKILTIIAGLIGLCIIGGGTRLYANVYSELPDISEVKNMVFSEATIITDRNDKVLYKLFTENREYIPLQSVSPHIVNAIIAMEDQRYREHNGLDAMGILRAAISKVLNPGSRLQGASTIPQQLVRNLLLTRDRVLDRKLKEIVLTKRLDGVLEKKIREENKGISSDDLRQEMKEEVLELYLNYIFLGNNAYGVEAASKTYFGTSARAAGPLEASVLASIPKGPSLYDPYKNRKLVMGEIQVLDPTDVAITPSTGLHTAILNEIQTIIANANIKNKNSNNDLVKYLNDVIDFNIQYQGNTYEVQYVNGRKDIALGRMFEEGYINDQEVKKAFLDGLDYNFKSAKFTINAPHFVHRVTELLEEQYDQETLFKGGFTVKTSLDLDMQQQAEKLINENSATIQGFGGNNQAMVYLDSQNGDVLAYVGSQDYFNEDIEGKNDMVRSARQAGSSVKPFIYSLAFMELPLTLDTPIYDIPFNAGGDLPNNADGEFLGMLPLRQALAYSRNIPAIKTFLALGGEAVAKPFLKNIGMQSLSDNIEYGYPMALGAGEIQMLELANAYMHLSALGEPAVINPILEIKSRDGSIVYEKEVEKQEQVIPVGIASLIWEIISNTANMPAGWVSMFSVRGIRLGIKSGTSNVQTENGNRARDGWLAAYTPSKVAVFWGGNTDAKPLNRNAFGASLNDNVMRGFFNRLRDNNHIVNEPMPTAETIDIKVNKFTGLPAGEATPSDFVVTSKAYVYNQPGSKDAGATQIEYDALCNGAVGSYTPNQDLKIGYVIQPTSIMPSKADLDDIRLRRTRGTMMMSNTGRIAELPKTERELVLKTKFPYNNVFMTAPTEPCTDRIPQDDPNIKVSIVQPGPGSNIARNGAITFSIQGPRLIREVNVFIGDTRIGRSTYDIAREKITDLVNINIPSDISSDEITISVVAVDIQGFSNKATQRVTIVDQDTSAPKIENTKVTKQADGSYEVRIFFVDDLSAIKGGKVTQNGSTIHTIQGSLASFKVTTLGTISISVNDSYNNTLTQEINLNNYVN